VHLVGIDIFTGRRHEDVRPVGRIIQVPKVDKKDYILVSIANDGYTTLLDEDTCQIRSDLSIQDSDTARRLRD
ncbi:unnamed protein product, partial [Rotaria magnacalcarata]